MKHGTSLRGQIGPRRGAKYIKNQMFCILFLIHLSFCTLLTENQCKQKIIIFDDLRSVAPHHGDK